LQEPFKRIQIGCITHVSWEIIPNIRTGHFHGESMSVYVGKVYDIAFHLLQYQFLLPFK